LELTEKIAKYAADLKFKELPESVVRMAKLTFLDFIGAVLAGSSVSEYQPLVDIFKSVNGKRESTILVQGEKAPVPFAALLNSTFGHALALDDIHDLAVIHPSTCTVPAALAIAELEEASGRDLITAYVVGCDIMCRISLARKLPHVTTGWVNTPVIGVFGAAVSAGKILGLSEERMVNALGIAYGGASGNIQVSRAPGRALMIGRSVENGVLAALLAKRGYLGPRAVLEGPYGFFNVYQRGQYDPKALVRELGEQFESINLSFKLYPSCRFTHTGIDAMLKAVNEYSIKPWDVDYIEADVNTITHSVVCDPPELKYLPKKPVDAQFSLPYTLACALVQKDVFIDAFTEKAIKRADVLAASRKIKTKNDPELDRIGREFSPMVLKIFMKNLEKHVVRLGFPRGHPRNPITKKELYTKIRKCSKYAAKPISNEKITELIKVIEDLDKLKNLTELIEILG